MTHMCVCPVFVTQSEIGEPRLSAYDDQIEQLKDRIHEQRALRDAQAEGSPQYEYFQAQATALADQLLALQDAAPDLAQLDAEIAEARRALEREQLERDEQHRLWNRITVSGAVTGLGSLLVALVVASPWWVWVLAGAGFAVAAFGLVRWTQEGHDSEERIEAARGELGEVQERRRQRARGLALAG